MAGSAHTLSSHTQPQANQPIGIIVTAWTADDTTGAIPTLAVVFPYDCQLVAISTNPGSTAPTDNYDITLDDAFGMDRLAGAGANRDTANTETAAVTAGYARNGESLTLTPTGNVVNSATGQIEIVYVKVEA